MSACCVVSRTGSGVGRVKASTVVDEGISLDVEVGSRVVVLFVLAVTLSETGWEVVFEEIIGGAGDDVSGLPGVAVLVAFSRSVGAE